MKKIAVILCVFFALVQFAPAVCTVLQIETGLFLVDEEKSPEKMQTADGKDTKTCQATIHYNDIIESKLNTAYHLSEKIKLSPCLEKHTPPPNFS
jgi:hypothetical protein